MGVLRVHANTCTYIYEHISSAFIKLLEMCISPLWPVYADYVLHVPVHLGVSKT